MKRIIIFTGKGGVGKTSIAAAHALKAAKQGYKTLIVSTDMAHNLTDLLGCPIGREETEVLTNLYALEIDPTYEMHHDFSAMMVSFQKLLSFQNQGEEDPIELLEMFPGIEELFSLLKIHRIFETGDYNLIIVDCAPTGETLALLKFPELLSWYMEKFFPLGKLAVKIARPITKTFLSLELPDGKAMNDIERLYLKLNQLQLLLKDRSVSSVRLVTLPEKMVVEETKRNFMYMSLYGFNVDGIYINRVLPTELDNPFFDQWITIQAGYLAELEAIFANIPICRIPWFDLDLNGIKGLERLDQVALDVPDLFGIRTISSGERYEKDGVDYRLSFTLPAVTKEELLVHQSGNDLIIRIGNVKRAIRLPDLLRGYEVAKAGFTDHELTIRFARIKEQSL
ncbi:MAG: ArsA family ATPase [Lachnospiraceae bacterium]|jgi:arsenite-transporting ATPase|nr:ArsA family ATPase [Lachnospiraceae bacterium]